MTKQNTTAVPELPAHEECIGLLLGEYREEFFGMVQDTCPDTAFPEHFSGKPFREACDDAIPQEYAGDPACLHCWEFYISDNEGLTRAVLAECIQRRADGD